MQWIYLGLAIIFEVAGTTSMKLSDGFTNLVPSILLLVLYLTSLVFLTLALKRIEVSVAYAVWSGMGIVIISVMGLFYFNEQLSLAKVIAILLIIIGVVTLNLSEGTSS
ncbi:DMT family transporter [Paenibacillus sp. SYP-B4298]|uniref:DMT family transporter n=1 Tax=Paenibacillus sp. SYP-B4298 TaxID=2996034 RepID=UPI0022DD3DB5|nr:multidrug efflux SMR transporter [Paenibacillus sp. SYP-B4298]